MNTTVVGTLATFTVQVSSTNPNFIPSPIAMTEQLRGLQQIPLATLMPNAAGAATFTTTKLSVGGHNIEAEFIGDALHDTALARVHPLVTPTYTTMTVLTCPSGIVYPGSLSQLMASLSSPPPAPRQAASPLRTVVSSFSPCNSRAAALRSTT